jgi:hypothetical protein
MGTLQMKKLWQLKNLTTNEPLNEPQPLPENWGPVFGLSGFIDKLDDLGWLGEEYANTGWVIVGEESDPPIDESLLGQTAWERAKQLLQESDWTLLPDVPMNKGDKSMWIEYRRQLREIKLQAGFPFEIEWPSPPE